MRDRWRPLVVGFVLVGLLVVGWLLADLLGLVDGLGPWTFPDYR